MSAKPNWVTAYAVEHPYVYSALTGVAVVVLAFAVLGTVSGTVALVGAVVGGMGVTLLNVYLWRADGPGRRWAEAHQRARRIAP